MHWWGQRSCRGQLGCSQCYRVLCSCRCSSNYKEIIHSMRFCLSELRSVRDLVIQMPVRRAPSVFFLGGGGSGAFLRNRMPYLDDIWYVGGARAEGAHAEFWARHMLIKYLICIIYSKNCPEHFSGTVRSTLMIFGMCVGLGPKVCMLNFWRGTYTGPLGPLGSKMLNNDTKLGFLGNRMPYLDDTWYVGRAIAEGAHAEFWHRPQF